MHKTLTERGYHMTDAEFRTKQGEMLLQKHEAEKALKLNVLERAFVMSVKDKVGDDYEAIEAEILSLLSRANTAHKISAK